MKLKILNNPQVYCLGIAFITFSTKKIADLVETNWSTKFDWSLSNITKIFTSSKFYTIQRPGGTTQVPIKVDRAPNPNDISWKDLGVSNQTAIIRRVITFFGTIFLLGCSFGALLGLKVGQYKMNQNNDDNGLSVSSLKFRLVSVGITLVIQMINFALGKLIRYLTFLERHWTETAFFQSLTIKIVVVKFLLFSVPVRKHQLARYSYPSHHFQARRGYLGKG